MTGRAKEEALERSLRAAWRGGPAQGAPQRVRQALEEGLAGVPLAERIAVARRLRERIAGGGARAMEGRAPSGGAEWGRLAAMLLGDRVNEAALAGAGDVAERLAAALNTVFDKLNAIVGGIHATLLGRTEELETIRFIIGSGLEGKTSRASLPEYLDRIEEAFSVAHRAFQEAARRKMAEVLEELSPENVASKVEGGLKFGALRKAELYDVYEERFRAVKKAFDTGRLGESLLREFERVCQRIYQTEGRGRP